MQIDFFYKFQLHIQIDRPFNFKQHDNNLGDFFFACSLVIVAHRLNEKCKASGVYETTEHENSSLNVGCSINGILSGI